MPTQASVSVTICNRLGLHARPAMSFVETATNYESNVTVGRGDHRVDGKSIMQIMMLAATKGTTLEIEAEGPDADEAVAALKDLVDRGFDED